MKLLIHFTDGTGSTYIAKTEGSASNLLNYHYPLHGIKAELIRDAKCETDKHYLERTSKPAIAQGTIVDVQDYWMNFHGGYFRVLYDGVIYDIAPTNCRVSAVIKKV